MHPSFSTQVNRSSLANSSAAFAPSTREMLAVSVHPLSAILPLIASTEIMTRCFPIASQSSLRNCVLRMGSFSVLRSAFHAAEPMMTFSAPSEISCRAFFTSRIPPPTLTLPLRSRDFSSSVFFVLPFSSVLRIAASRSMIATSPYVSNCAIRASASSRCNTRSLPFFN